MIARIIDDKIQSSTRAQGHFKYSECPTQDREFVTAKPTVAKECLIETEAKLTITMDMRLDRMFAILNHLAPEPTSNVSWHLNILEMHERYKQRLDVLIVIVDRGR
jgi:hypothetical protein